MEQQGNNTAVVATENDVEQLLDLTEVKPATSTSSKLMHNLYARMGSESKRTVLALLTTIVPTILVQLALHNILVTMVVFTIPFLGWGVRVIDKFHCSLLIILWVRRTQIGFHEGIVWVPWFLGGKLDPYDTRRRKLDIPKEDNWTTDSMHLVYDIVLNYGIAPVKDEGFWKNFFRYFICIFKHRRNAQLLYNFTEQINLKSTIEIMVSDAADLTIKAVNSRGFAEIFQQKDDQIKLKNSTIQEDLIDELNKSIESLGFIIYKYNLKDIDFHEDTAKVLQEKFLATVRGEAREKLYEVVARVAKKLATEGQEVTDAAIQIEMVEALKDAAKGDGVVGMLLQSMTAKNILPAKT